MQTIKSLNWYCSCPNMDKLSLKYFQLSKSQNKDVCVASTKEKVIHSFWDNSKSRGYLDDLFKAITAQTQHKYSNVYLKAP